MDDDPTAPAIARRHARSQLATWGVDEDTTYATEQIVSELVTNALRYGAPPVRLRLIKDRNLTCEVHDSSPTAPPATARRDRRRGRPRPVHLRPTRPELGHSLQRAGQDRLDRAAPRTAALQQLSS
ncbi:ATP-binding protein [Streptomyces melanosporofaciens]